MIFSFVPPINKDPIYLDARGCVGKRKRTEARQRKSTKPDDFILDFAAELDLFDSGLDAPNWVFSYRDNLIRKMSAKQMAMCRWLKDNGFDFKIKWPVQKEDKWKFADVFLPKQSLIIIFANPMSNFRPVGLPSYRAEWFKDRFNVIEIETPEELNRKLCAVI